MQIKVKRLSEDEINKSGIRNWPVWEKEISEFDWYYDSNEECLLTDGKVQVETEDGNVTEFGAGDFVFFPEGMACRWKVIEPVRKHYKLS